MINLYEPRTMLKVVERMAGTKTFLRDTFFKNVLTFPTESVDVDFKKGRRKLAPFVHEKIGGKIVENSGFVTETFKPALVAPHKVTTAFDLKSRLAGEGLYSTKTPDERAAEKLVADLQELDEMVTRREEFMCSQAIFTGKIDIVGEGIDRVIDFNFTNKETLSGSDKWTDPASDPIGDLKRWARQVQMNGFVNADMVIMESSVADAFVNHEKVQNLLNVRNLYAGEVRTARELPNGVSYVGTLPGANVDIYEYNEYYLDDFTDPTAQATKPMVPEGFLALMSSTAQYSLAYGAITKIENDGFVTYEAARVPDKWTEKRPDRQFLGLSSKPLPIPHEVDSWFIAKVL